MINYLKILRPKHWVKNLIVFAPMLFAEVFCLNTILETFLGFICFSLCASVIYIFNDIIDYNSDKTNQYKQDRPIASGKISKKNALIYGVFLLIIDIIICMFLPIYFSVTLGIYFILNLCYIFKLKQIEIIDVLCLSVSFILRLFAGSYSADVDLTKWILVTGFFLALFLGFSKRQGEVLQDNEGLVKRKVASIYTKEILDKFIISTGMLSVICYAIYTLDTNVIEKFQSPHLFYSIIFPVYGVFRYLMIISTTKDTDPTNILFKDKSFFVCIILWLITTLSIMHFHL